MKCGTLSVLVAALASSVASGAAPSERYDVESAFAETDTNQDGSIEIDEFFDRLVEIYFHGDADKNGTLSPEEFAKAVVVQQEFASVDRNGDGAVDRREFVRTRLPMFLGADLDRDGALSLAEVKAALEGRASR